MNKIYILAQDYGCEGPSKNGLLAFHSLQQAQLWKDRIEALGNSRCVILEADQVPLMLEGNIYNRGLSDGTGAA